jgi:predicted alpha/beta-fold hydrolase
MIFSWTYEPVATLVLNDGEEIEYCWTKSSSWRRIPRFHEYSFSSFTPFTHFTDYIRDRLFTKEVVHVLDTVDRLCDPQDGDMDTEDRDIDGIVILHHSLFGFVTEHAWLAFLLSTFYRKRVLAFSRRGHRRLHSLKNPVFNSTGCVDDLEEVLTKIVLPEKKRLGGVPVFSFATSAGTSSVSLYMGRKKEESLIDGAVLVSPGFHFRHAVTHIPFPYHSNLLRTLKTFFLHKNKTVLQRHDPQGYRELEEATTLLEWHERQHKFSFRHDIPITPFPPSLPTSTHHLVSADRSQHYWDVHEPFPLLKEIRKPILFLNAKDDPIFPYGLIQPHISEALKSPFSVMILTERGKHIMFQTKPFEMPWMYTVAIQFYETLLNFKE